MLPGSSAKELWGLKVQDRSQPLVSEGSQPPSGQRKTVAEVAGDNDVAADKGFAAKAGEWEDDQADMDSAVPAPP